MKAEDSIVDFLFEVGILSKTPRSGFFFLGSGEQSVAEHTNRVCYIGYVLGTMRGNVDTGKIMKMCLLHDVPEARTSDLNYVHQKYAQANPDMAVKELAETLPFGKDLQKTIDEYEERKTPEALLAKDADNLEFILALKEQSDVGNARADTWLPNTVKRLKTPEAKRLAKKIVATDSDRWWYGDKNDPWWINRDGRS